MQSEGKKLNYLSKTSYEMILAINEIQKETYQTPKKIKGLLILFMITFLSSIFSALYIEDLPIWIPVCVFLVAVVTFIYLMKKSKEFNDTLKKERVDDNYIVKLDKCLRDKDLYNLTKIEFLIREIVDSVEFHNNKYEEMKNLCYKIFRNVFWIPFGILLGALIGINNTTISYEAFESLIPLLVVITIYLIAFIILTFPIDFSYIFHSERLKKENAIRALFDVKYRMLK